MISQTAGHGVYHSELNLEENDPLRFIQIWINTRQRGVQPNYGSMIGNDASRENRWAHLVSDASDRTTSTPVKINQDVNIHVTEVSPGHEVSFELKDDRQAYLLCIEGNAAIASSSSVSEQCTNETMEKHDAAELFGPNTFKIKPLSDDSKAHMLLVEMEFTGMGRTDL